MQQDTGKFRTNLKDQYYTKQTVAQKFVEMILSRVPEARSYQWIEPSAGNGVFLKSLPEGIDAIGLDIDPKGTGILNHDFLTWTPTSRKPRIVFGNPPFGRQGSLAKAFVKHACSFAEIVAFILPRSFQKPSMVSSIPKHFHCLVCENIEERAFEVNGEAYDVPCIFQIWKKLETNRPDVAVIEPAGFSYVKPIQSYHFVFRRVGGTAGRCAVAPGDFSPSTHYFIRLEDNYISSLREICDELNKKNYVHNTLGPRSISKREANMVINDVLEYYD
jgi:hypothetical protein